MLTPTHRQLAMFRTVMLHGNLSRAAEVLASSQPTLSRELARLEQVLGFALFDRIGGRLRPTVRALELLKERSRVRRRRLDDDVAVRPDLQAGQLTALVAQRHRHLAVTDQVEGLAHP